MLSPCKGCERRKLLCHSVCEEYKAFSAKIEEARKVRALENDKHPSWKERMRDRRK